jgi:hypothetical protein
MVTQSSWDILSGKQGCLPLQCDKQRSGWHQTEQAVCQISKLAGWESASLFLLVWMVIGILGGNNR